MNRGRVPTTAHPAPSAGPDAGPTAESTAGADLLSASGWLRPAWTVAPTVHALVTTRAGGVSTGPYGCAGGAAGGLNLGDHVGDDPRAVAVNRSRLPVAPRWLQQVHGVEVVRADAIAPGTVPVADAAYTTVPGVACAVLTADCMPVLLADRAGRVVGVAHAGWRGLAAGVIERLVAAMRAAVPAADPVAWLGPAIGPARFEVGPEVRAAFMVDDAQAAAAFVPGRGDRWFADLPQLARARLHALGVGEVTGGECCTVSDSARFYSYRRDGVTGRFASLIWIAPPGA